MSGGLDRANMGAVAQLALLNPATGPEQIAVLADASRRLGDLASAKLLLSAVPLPNGPAFAASRALKRVLDEAGPSPCEREARPAAFVRRRAFLPETVLTVIKRLTAQQLDTFVSSEVHDEDYSGVDVETRRSLVLPEVAQYRDLLVPHLLELLSSLDLERVLGVAPLDVRRIELQVTGHGDGSFFKPHTDASRSANGGRELSFVFYFKLTPEGFTGGSLRLFDAAAAQQRFAQESFTCVEPEDNSLILFPSRCVHEVEAVHVPSGRLSSGRFSINGWLHGRAL